MGRILVGFILFLTKIKPILYRIDDVKHRIY